MVGAISHLRRINTPGDMIMIGQRKLHPTQYGIICPVETPDGGNIGIKKHLTVMGHITFGCDPQPIIKLLGELGVKKLEDMSPSFIYKKTKIFVNGKWIGIHEDPVSLTRILRLFRRNALINIFTSISWNITQMEISILTDGGRCCRPLYIVKDVKAGEILTTENVRAIRPGLGLPTKYLEHVLGKTVNQNVTRGTALSWEILS